MDRWVWRRCYWLGSYELDKQCLFSSTLKTTDVVYDIGANVGFYTLLAATHCAFVYAFEPLSTNVKYLRRHLDLNKIRNCRVIDVAVSANNGWAPFATVSSRFEGRLSPEGKTLVETASIDSIISQLKLRPPSVLKIDIEGAEQDCLLGAVETLRNYKPVIFLAIHGNQAEKDCLGLLAEIGYRHQLLPNSTDEFIVTHSNMNVARFHGVVSPAPCL